MTEKVALLFPGQGSQSVGMGGDFYDYSPVVRGVYQEAEGVLGFDPARLCFEGPEERLNRTEFTQPALLITSIAIFRLMVENHPIEFSFVAGHSLGEYSALVAAGGVRFQDAVRLVRSRGRYMQEAVPEGKGMMAAILGLDRATLEGICRESSHSGYVAMANYNSPDQVVIAGERDGVECAMEMARAKGAKRVIPLPVSVPSHCALMESASRRLEGDLLTVEVADLKVPLVNNAEGRPISKGEEIKPSLVRQLASPLLWEESIRFMISSGVSIFVEVGPGRVLSGLVKRIDRSVQTLPVEDVRALQETLNIVG